MALRLAGVTALSEERSDSWSSIAASKSSTAAIPPCLEIAGVAPTLDAAETLRLGNSRIQPFAGSKGNSGRPCRAGSAPSLTG
jgi:hypothetical protein